MRRFLSIAITGVLLTVLAGCSGKRPGAWMGKSHLAMGCAVPCDLIIDREGYALGYSNGKRQALWVSYVLKKEDLTHGRKRSNIFKADPLVEKMPVQPHEYSGTGYDRGHLAPAADMVRSRKVMDESFYMSNVSPQFPECNRKYWLEAEKHVRRFARKEGAVYVISVPYFSGENKKSISDPPIPVPDGFCKAVLDLTYPYKMIAFYVPNTANAGQMQIMSVREAEKLTGYDFFSELDDWSEYRLESSVDLAAWDITEKR
ncbi:MAG: DNA/RNA non-specific endonuclease [Lentisphaerae bacterium]|nr:DNA/RNA non-specific endonuclease [Lentisphaerota bacterium]